MQRFIDSVKVSHNLVGLYEMIKDGKTKGDNLHNSKSEVSGH